MVDGIGIVLCALMFMNVVSVLPFVISGLIAGRNNEPVDPDIEDELRQNAGFTHLGGFTWLDMGMLYLALTALQFIWLCLGLWQFLMVRSTAGGYMFTFIAMSCGLGRGLVQKKLVEQFGDEV